MADKKIISIDIKVSERNASKSINTAKTAVDGLAASTERLARASKDNRAQSGLNNAILIETGRVASDSAYGIQGVANNIGRLTELFQEFSRTGGKGGVAGAFKELGKSLLGVGGIIVAFQLLLSFLPKLLKGFKEWAAEITAVNKALEDSTEVYGEQIGRLETYVEMLNDSNVSDEQKAIILKKVAKEHEGLNLQMDETNNLTDDSIERTQLLTEVLTKKAQSQALLNEIQEKYIEQFKLQNSSLVESTGFLEIFYGILAGAGTGLGGVSTMVSESIKARNKELKQIGVDIDLLQEKLKEIGIFPDDKKKVGARLRTFKQQLLDLSKLEEQFRQQSEMTFILDEEERILKQQEFDVINLDIRVQQFKERQKLRLEEFLESKASDEEKQKARQEYLESINKADKEAADVRIQIAAATETKLIELESSQRESQFKSDRKRQELEISNLKYSLDANQYYANEKMALLEQDIQFEELRLKTALLSIDQRAAAELKLTQLQSQLNETKLQQNLDFIKENQRIDLIYVGFAQQTSDLLSNIAGENEAIQKAALLVEKGAAVADIVVRTQSSNQIIRAGYAAKAALAPIGGGVFKAMAQAEITRNNIGAALSIANILATTISSFKKPSGGGGAGGGTEVEAPDFNVVGASPESQLAQSVASQQQKPLRAFVVGKDITNQQELERNIKTTSGLGD